MDTQRSQHYFNNGPFGQETSRSGGGGYMNDFGISDNDFAKVAENRSLYGNYVDNALAYDPSKEKRSMYDVVYTSDVYDPWGKPGGGAPQIDRRTGRLQTKIEGRLQWNLDGQTLSAKSRRYRANPKLQPPNLIEYRKTPSPQFKKPMPSEVTTYRQVFGGIDNNNNIQLLTSRNASRERNQAINGNMNSMNVAGSMNQTDLEREADTSRTNVNRYLKVNNDPQLSSRPNQSLNANITASRSNFDNRFSQQDLSSSSNFNNNSYGGGGSFNSNSQQPSDAAQKPPGAYEYSKWFNINGGGGAPTNDARRRKLLDMLENRHLQNQQYTDRRAQSDFLYPKTTNFSSHKNNYERP